MLAIRYSSSILYSLELLAIGMHAAEAAARASMIGAANAVLGNEGAEFGLFFRIILVDEHVHFGCRLDSETSRLDIDMPTGQASGKAGVLAVA